MVKKIIGGLFILYSQFLFSQSDSSFVEQKMIKAALTISPSLMLNHPSSNIYLSGDLEYFFDKHLSLRGDGVWYIDAQNKTSLLASNVILYFGALYHISNKLHDFNFGFQPGLSLTTLNNQLYKNEMQQAIPNVSLLVGYNFYCFEYMNFFVNCRYVRTKFYGSSFGSVALDELIFSAGLGWQIRFKHLK